MTGGNMYINTEMIINAAEVVSAVVLIFTVIFSAYRWYLKQNKQDAEIKQMKEEDIKQIKEDLCMHTYVLLAILDGLKQQGCNGPVTEARNKLQKHINKQAHDVGE